MRVIAKFAAPALSVALSIAAPLGAGAATRSTYTSPLTTLHRSRPAEVYLTFQNHTSQDREVVIGSQTFKIDYNRTLRLAVPVGSVVRLYSEMNSKVNGQQWMQVSAADNNRLIDLK